MTSPDTWYVSYSPSDAPARGGRGVRLTRRFKSEGDAKRFAQEIIKTADNVMAGTLNPCWPRRVVPPNAMLDWISEREKPWPHIR